MNEIVDLIRSIRKQRKELENREKEMLKSICFSDVTVESVKNLFFIEKGIDSFENMEQKKMFIYVCISIICPTFIIGDRLNYTLRKNLSKHTSIHPVQISYISKNVITYYEIYKSFKSEADYLYNSIKRSLTS